LRDLGNGRVVVVLAAVVATVNKHAPRFFAQVAAIRIGKKRID
jgi:hypothetical protein